MKTNRLLGVAADPLPETITYVVCIPQSNGEFEIMCPTPYRQTCDSARLKRAAKNWANQLGWYVQLTHWRYGVVASAWPDDKPRS